MFNNFNIKYALIFGIDGATFYQNALLLFTYTN